MQNLLVVLPSYNESRNIEGIIDTILNVVIESCEIYVYVVDDNSPDGTPDILQKKFNPSITSNRYVEYRIRNRKSGRGSAVHTGLLAGLARKIRFDFFVEMDCDFSHDPGDIPKGIELLRSGGDVVLGSRYPDGVIEGWSKKRNFFSRLANHLAQILISPDVHDYTNGYRFYTREMVEILINNSPRTKGYIYLSETLAIFLSRKVNILEFPIVFRNRVRGKSNITVLEVISALLGLFIVGVVYRLGKI